MPPHGRLDALIRAIYHYTHHVSDIFPDDTDKLVTLTAGNVVDTFGAWAPIVDSVPVEFSTVFAAQPGLIVSVLIEECSVTDKRYMLEVSYGATRVVVGRSRFMKEAVMINVGHQTRVRSISIPAGETVYYRLKCETADATAKVHFRYYLV